MEGEGWNSHWKFRGRHWINKESSMVDVSETGRAGRSRRRGHEDVMLDGITITPFGGGKVGVGQTGYCDGVEADHVELPLLAAKPGSGRPSRSGTMPGNVQNVQNAMLSRLCTRLFDAVGWICDLGRWRRAP